MNHTIKVIIDRFENDKAVLVTPIGQQIFWPREALPEEAEVGSIHTLGLDIHEHPAPPAKPNEKAAEPIPTSTAFTENQKKELAITMLEELLNAEEKQGQPDPNTQKTLL